MKEVIIIVSVCIIISLASLFQTFVYISKTPIGFVYPLVHNYEPDYYWYLSLMRQGWDGSLRVTTYYTPEEFVPQFVNTFFPASGMVARVLHISLPMMYTVLRVIGGSALLFVSYKLLKELGILKDQIIVAFSLLIFGAPLWYLAGGGGGLHQIGEFWTGFDPILRISWLPHHTISNFLMIATFIQFYKAYLAKSIKLYAFAGVIGAVSVWLNPASIITLAITLGIGMIPKLVRQPKVNKLQVTGVCIFTILIGLPVFWLWNLQNSTFPWTAFGDWERFVQYPIDTVEYVLTLGLVGFLAIPGIYFAIKKQHMLWNMVVGWFLTPILGLLFFMQLLPISNGRFLQSAGYIPAAILATASLRILSNQVGKKKNILIFLTTIAIVILQIPSFIASHERQLGYVEKNVSNPLIMVPKETWEALQYLDKEGFRGVIAAPENISTLIPAFTSLRVMTGHPTFTYQSQQKSSDLAGIYTSGDIINTQSLVQKYNISYIWIDSSRYNADTFSKMSLRKVYNNSGIIIYEK